MIMTIIIIGVVIFIVNIVIDIIIITNRCPLHNNASVHEMQGIKYSKMHPFVLN